VEECGPFPMFASFTQAFALQLRKKHGKPSVRVRKTSVRVQYKRFIIVYFAKSKFRLFYWECLRWNIPILEATAIRIVAEEHVRTYSTNLRHRLYFLKQDESNVSI